MYKWAKHNIIWVRIEKYWKGIYIYFLPKYYYTIYWHRGVFNVGMHLKKFEVVFYVADN